MQVGIGSLFSRSPNGKHGIGNKIIKKLFQILHKIGELLYFLQDDFFPGSGKNKFGHLIFSSYDFGTPHLMVNRIQIISDYQKGRKADKRFVIIDQSCGLLFWTLSNH